MSLYVGIDLHSTNSYIGIINDEQCRIVGCRVPNDKLKILALLRKYKKDISGVVVESTYNWYWLIDMLMDEDYKLHLANPAKIQKYKGLKHSDDKTDSFWLAEMLKLGILPEGYIYPKEMRGIRDLLRHRSRLVNKRTSLKFMLQQICENQTGVKISNNFISKQKTTTELSELFTSEEWKIHAESLLETIFFLEQKIRKVESFVLKNMRHENKYKRLQSVPGIAEVLGLTIALETGPIERFETAKDYASYCRCVPSQYWSNGKKKGSGNEKNGNKYLSWAFAEAANFSIRFCPETKAYYQRKVAKTNQPKAYRSIANKLSKACFYIMRDDRDFDVKKLFSC